MISHIKELIVVMALALAVFAAAKPLCLRFMRAEDYTLRRNVWLVLTLCAFLAPNFWVYALVALVVLVWAARRDSNPAALYLLAYAIIPPIKIYLPVVGINQLFALDQARILSLVVLLPLAYRLFAANEGGIARKLTPLDWLLVAYTLLQLAVVSPYESFTNTMRRGFLFSIDTLVVYYVFSRAMVNRRVLVDALAVFVLVGGVYATIGIFESFKGWLMYEQIAPGWGAINDGSFLLRDGSLRAQASAGHSLTLGYTLAMALGVWFYLRSEVASRAARLLVPAVLCLGLYATHSRGPWLTGVVVYFIYLFIAPGSKSQLLKGLAVFTVIVGVLLVTPFGARIIDMLPFIGTVDQANVIYRQRLATESWHLILQNPWLGDPFVTLKMDDLKQGYGFVDLMNAYAAVGLFNGFVGLALFLGFFFGATGRAYAVQRKSGMTAPDLSGVGAALVACMLASFFFMATASIDWIEYVLAGLLSGYVSLLARRAAAVPASGYTRPPISPERGSVVLGKS